MLLLMEKTMTRTFTPDEIAALIAKLEAATGPDRNIDAEIWWRMNRKSAETVYWNAASGLPRDLGDKIPSGLGWVAVTCYAEPYTKSIDAAATLAPEGHDWALHVDNGKAIAGCMPASEDGCDCSDSLGATPAIALTIAALKARASIRESGTRPTGEPGVTSPPAHEASGPVGRDSSTHGEQN